MSNKFIVLFVLIPMVTLRAMESPDQNNELNSKYIACRLIEDIENNRESTWFVQEDLSEEKQEAIKKTLARYFSNKLWTAFAKEIYCKELDCMHEVFYVAISNDNRFIVTSFRDSSMQIWDIQTNEATYIAAKQGIAKSKDKKTAIIATDKIAEIWDLESNQCFHSLIGHNSLINAVAISKDNFIFTYASDGIIKIWDAQTYKLLYSLNICSSGASTVISKDNKLMAKEASGVIYSGKVNVYDLENDKRIHSLNCCFIRSVTSIAISTDNELILAGDYNRRVSIWDIQAERLIHTIITGGPEDDADVSYLRPTYIAISNDNIFIVTDGFDEKKAKIWSLPLEKYSLNEILEKIRKSCANNNKSFFASLWDGLNGMTVNNKPNLKID